LITSGVLDRPRKLVLAESHLEYENWDLRGQEFTRLEKSDIIDFKHGTDSIVWYKLVVGRQYAVALKAKNNRELSIHFDSYFGLHKGNKQKYADIVGSIWKLYHSDIVDAFLDGFYNGMEAKAQGIVLKTEGIELKGGQRLVPWDKVAIKEYYGYFAIYHQGDSTIHSTVSNSEYGAETLWSAVATILKTRGMNASQQQL